MKLTAILLLAFCLQVGAKSRAQRLTIHEKNISLKKVFKEINKQTGYNFFYEDELLNKADKISINVKDAPLEDVLNNCFKDLPFGYKISDKTIIITPVKNESTVKIIQPDNNLTALNIIVENIINGVVVDQKGDPVPFASIQIKGEKVGVNADENGVFSLKITGNHALLVVSSINFVSKTVEVSSENKKVIVVLTSKNIDLSPAVITTALNIKRSMKSLGYATEQVDGKSISQSVPVSAAAGIMGKVSGLNIQLVNSSVDPNSFRITLRGNRSFTGTNTAFVVIDGVPSSTTYLSQMNVNDIENIDVLKGSTAAALYGSDAANGVLIVTTKTGKKSAGGKDVININSTITVDQVSFVPKLQYKFGPASTEYESADAISYSDPTNFQNGYVSFENQSFGPAYNGNLVALTYPAQDGEVLYVPYSARPHEFRKFWKVAPTFQNSISYSGNTETSSYYLSMQNINRSGIMPDDKYIRNTVRFNGAKQYGAFKMSANIMYSARNMSTVANSFSVYNQITNLPTFIPFTDYSDPTKLWGDLSTFYAAYAYNPYWYIKNSRNNTTTSYIVGDVNLSLKVNPWLNIDYLMGINNYYNSYQFTQAAMGFSAYAIYMGNNTVSGNSTSPNGAPPQEAADNDNTTSFYSNIKMNFHKKIGNFNTQLIVGNAVNQSNYKYVYVGSTNLQNFPGLYNINYITGTPNVGQSISNSRKYGNFADLSLDYKNFIFLHASGRQDATSVLNPSYRKYFYPGIDAAVVLSDIIQPIKNSNTISFLKIRGAITKTGNVNVGPYGVQNVFTNGNGFPFSNLTGLTTPTTSTIANLSPEFTVSNEIGANISLLKGKIDFQATYFSEKTTNETVTASVSTATGYSNALRNLGEMDNKGVELDLKLVPVNTQNGLRWDIAFHYTHYENKVVSLGSLTQLAIGGNSYAIVGKPYTSLMLNDWLRDSLNRVVVDANSGYPSINPTNKYFGTTNPTNTLGINTSLKYKGFTLNVVAEYKGGNVIFNGVGQSFDADGLSYRSAQFDHSKFIYPNSVYKDPTTGSYVPNTSIQIQDAGIGWWSLPQSMYMTSGAFWALRNLSLTYEVPQRIMKKTKYIQNANISLIGSNLFFLTPKLNTWTSPEFSDAGIGNATGSNSQNQNPPTRTFGASINLSF